MNLTTSGWIFFAWTLAVALVLLVKMLHRRGGSVGLYEVVLLALQVTYLLWLVTP